MQQEIRSQQVDPPDIRRAPRSWLASMSTPTTRPIKNRTTLVQQLLTRLVVGVLVVTGAVAITARFQQRNGSLGKADDAVPVLASQARVADVPVYLEGVGTVRALNM